MKELAEDFKSIAKKDKNLFVWMTLNFLLSLWLFLTTIFNLNSGSAMVVARYSDINGGYVMKDWWYPLSIAVLAIAMGIGHTLVAARLYSKRGKDVSRLFLFISMIILVVGIVFALKIFDEG
jgi:hypothetical protein